MNSGKLEIQIRWRIFIHPLFLVQIALLSDYYKISILLLLHYVKKIWLYALVIVVVLLMKNTNYPVDPLEKLIRATYYTSHPSNYNETYFLFIIMHFFFFFIEKLFTRSVSFTPFLHFTFHLLTRKTYSLFMIKMKISIEWTMM